MTPSTDQGSQPPYRQGGSDPCLLDRQDTPARPRLSLTQGWGQSRPIRIPRTARPVLVCVGRVPGVRGFAVADPTIRRAGRRWRQLRTAVLAHCDICHLCGHPGADTVDHIVPLIDGGLEFDPGNLRPAHGRKIPGVCVGNYSLGATAGNRRRKPTPWTSLRW